MRVLLTALIALALWLPAHASSEWVRQPTWRILEARHVRVKAWTCERSAGLALSAYPQVRWRQPVRARRFHTLSYWRARLNVCRQQGSVGDVNAWLCIHRGEGAWNDSGDPYWGGLQMDRGFMATYGADMIRRYHGLANVWPPRVQMVVAERARASGRGYFPWPATARRCGLI